MAGLTELTYRRTAANFLYVTTHNGIKRLKRGVHNVHTTGFGFGCTGMGLGRLGDVFGGVAVLQARESSSSPTLGTVFPQVTLGADKNPFAN